MAEIIILFFLVKNIGALAIQKGEPPVKWKIYAILAWLAGEMIGVCIVYTYLALEWWLIMIFGLGVAYLFFLLLKKNLSEMPDIDH